MDAFEIDEDEEYENSDNEYGWKQKREISRRHKRKIVDEAIGRKSLE